MAKPLLGSVGSVLKPEPKVADPFYLSKPWRDLVNERRKALGNRCALCGVHGKDARLIGDHIIERKDGGADLDPNNVQLLCMAHHNEKTARARRERNAKRPARRV